MLNSILTISTPLPFKLFYISQKLANLVSKYFVTFPKIIWQYLHKNCEKSCICKPLRGPRSVAGIFKTFEGLDISFVMCHRKVFVSIISKKS